MPWRSILRENFTNLQKLADFLQLSDQQRNLLPKQVNFVLNLPKRLAEKITKGSTEDPLFKQFVPTLNETTISDDFVADPVGDDTFRLAPKLLKKYQGRALLIVTSACAMHCRYCFRQNFDYKVQQKEYEQELAVISADPSLEEIILSGGDPLSLPDHLLQSLLVALSQIPHVKRVRFHTRFPIGIPERITDDLIQLLKTHRFNYWFIVHVNHPNELDDDVFHALKKLICAGMPVLNQAVLLKGVNDSLQTLKELCTSLINHGILPYYLHQLDRVQGAQHFEVPQKVGLELIKELMQVLPGYGVPKYVQEIAGELHKSPIL